MPMSFPDYDSLRRRAAMWKFRPPRHDESEAEFRNALANFVQGQDPVESMEIRTKVGWDQFSAADNNELLLRAMLPTAALGGGEETDTPKQGTDGGGK